MSQPVKPIVCPSMLSCDFANLLAEAKRMLAEGADWLHMDVMDGHFVPNITLGMPIIASLRSHLPDVFLDCHMMVSDPVKWIQPMKQAGASQYTFHVEATDDPIGVATAIAEAGMKVGVVIKPQTPAKVLYEILQRPNLVHTVLIMTVEPGFGGQKFMEDMMPKVRDIRKQFPHGIIQVDGGIDASNANVVAEAGANAVVSGSGIFKATSSAQAIQSIRQSLAAHHG